MSNPALIPLVRDSRRYSYAVVTGIWLIVTVYAVLHDQYLVRIAPEHFTVYHPPLWGLHNPSLLAAAWAFQAATYPGFMLGVGCLLAARAGPWPRVGVRHVFTVVPLLVGLTEIIAASSGLWGWWRGQGLYPDWLYPDGRLSLLITQTIQLTCYAAGGLCSLGVVAYLLIRRWRAQQRRQCTEGTGP